MFDESDLALGWMKKGDSDLLTVQRLMPDGGPFDTACFHAQQAAEKYLKAVLAYAESEIPRTHNLEDLEKLCAQAVTNWDIRGAAVSKLTRYAVEGRYEFDFWPDESETTAALAIAQAVRDAVVAVLPSRAIP